MPTRPSVSATRLAGAVLVALLAAGPVARAADDPRLQANLEVIFDTSASMEDNGRFEPAKNALLEFLRQVPDGTRVGLIVFAGRRAEVAVPLGRLDRAKLEATVRSLRGESWTPILDSLALARNALEAQQRRQGGYGTYTIVLVTDGEETIANPDAVGPAVQGIVAAGLEVDVIGFDLPGPHSLRSLVTRYREARNQVELTRALNAMAEIESYEEVERFVREERAAAPPAAPPVPVVGPRAGPPWVPRPRPPQPGRFGGGVLLRGLLLALVAAVYVWRVCRRRQGGIRRRA